ncbi:hypothetical protein BH23GEM6_BH23GEM6_13090 [soil metagenome]
MMMRSIELFGTEVAPIVRRETQAAKSSSGSAQAGTLSLRADPTLTQGLKTDLTRI